MNSIIAVTAIIGALLVGPAPVALAAPSVPPAVGQSDEPEVSDATQPATATLHGIVTDRDGVPVAGVEVTVRQIDAPDVADLVGVTADDGRFEIERIVPGRVAVHFSAPQGSGLASEWHRDADSPEAAQRIDLVEHGVTEIKGVLDPLVVAGTVPLITGTVRVGSTLSVLPGQWSADAALSYRWFADGTPISGADRATLLLGAAQMHRAISVEVTGAIAGHTSTTLRSIPTAAVAPGVLQAAVPTITGNLRAGSTATAQPGQWTAGTTLAYQWFAEGRAIKGATGPTLRIDATLKDARLSVSVTGALAGYTTVTKTSTATPRVMTAATPTLKGSVVVGATLTATPGTWTAKAALAYQWFADGVAIPRAQSSTLALTAAQEGAAITVRVTGTRSGYATVTMTSSSTARVLRTATPSISGTLAHGSTVTANPGPWTAGASFTYRWFADGKEIVGATTAKLPLPSALRDKRISVTVTGTKPGHARASVSSATTPRVAVAATPTISGSASTGSTVTAVPGTWTKGATFRYQWFADGTAIKGATGRTLVVPEGVQHKRLTVTVQGAASGYATISRTSASTARVLRASTPTVSGAVALGRTVTVAAGTWTSGTRLSYQWFADGAAIRGATGSALSLSATHSGKRISVRVTGALAGYASATRTSAPTAVVPHPAPPKPAPSGGVKPISKTDCPSSARVKGNINSKKEKIYHVPGSRYYAATHPEVCFQNAEQAERAGFRAPRN